MNEETAQPPQAQETPAQPEPSPTQHHQPGGGAATKMGLAFHTICLYAGRAADEMVSLYNRALCVDPAYRAEYFKSVGVSHLRKGRRSKAIAPLEAALAITPDDTEARRHLGNAYFACNELGKAAIHLEKALEADAHAPGVLFSLGMLSSRKQDYDKAIEYFRKTIEFEPQNAQAHYRLGIAFDNKKLSEEAITFFKKAISIDPRDAKAHQALGFAYETIGDRESAVACFKKALELD